MLEEEEYLRRKVFYQTIGQRHYYFMNVGNGEVIDACRKARTCPLARNIDQQCACVSIRSQEHLACSTCCPISSPLRALAQEITGAGFRRAMGRLIDLSVLRESGGSAEFMVEAGCLGCKGMRCCAGRTRQVHQPLL